MKNLKNNSISDFENNIMANDYIFHGVIISRQSNGDFLCLEKSSGIFINIDMFVSSDFENEEFKEGDTITVRVTPYISCYLATKIRE